MILWTLLNRCKVSDQREIHCVIGMDNNESIIFINRNLLEFLNSKLPPVPEEDDMFRNSTLNTNYPDLDLMTPMNQINELSQESAAKNEQASQQPALAQNEQGGTIQNLQYTAKIYTQPQPEPTNAFRNNMWASIVHYLECFTMKFYFNFYMHVIELWVRIIVPYNKVMNLLQPVNLSGKKVDQVEFLRGIVEWSSNLSNNGHQRINERRNNKIQRTNNNKLRSNNLTPWRSNPFN